MMWALRPLTQRSGPVVELPVSFPSLAARKGFLYDLIDAAGMRTRATSIQTLRLRGEDALMEIGLQERLMLHQLNEVDKADTWLVCLNTARETWIRCRRVEVEAGRSRFCKHRGQADSSTNPGPRQITLQSVLRPAGYFTYVEEPRSDAWMPPPPLSLPRATEVNHSTHQVIPEPVDTDSFHYVLDAMEHLSGFAKAWVSLADICSEATVTSEQALEALTFGAGLDLFSMKADNSWRLSDSFAFVSPPDSAT